MGGDDAADDDENGDAGDDSADDGPFFEVSNLDPDEESITQGDPIDVSAIVTNTGDEDGEQDVEVRVGDETLDSETLSLELGDSETVSFEGLETNDIETGEHTHGVYSDDDEATGTLTVEEAEPAFFEVTAVEPGDATVEHGETVDVSATITNTGEVETTQDVTLEFDGDDLESESVSLSGGEDETVSLGSHETDGLEIGEYEYVVATDDDEMAATLTVEEPPLLSVPFGLNTGGALEGEEPQSDEPVVIGGLEFVPVASADEVDELNNVHIFGDEPEDADWFEPPAQKGGETGGEIEGTDYDALYQTELFGYNLGFEFEIDNGTYDVILHNAEIFHDEEGARVFDVMVQGEPVAEELDMVAEVGDHVAHTITLEEVEVENEVLTIETTTHEDFSKFAGIEIRWGGDPLERGLEAYFPLDDDTPINQVTGNEAEVIGEPTSGAEGIVNDAWEFSTNDTTDSVEDTVISEPLALNGESATVGAWVNHEEITEEYSRVYHIDESGDPNSPSNGWNVEFGGTDNTISQQFWDGGGIGADNQPSVPCPQDEWVFVVTVIDGNNSTIYVFDEDGQLDDSPATGGDGIRAQSEMASLILMAGDGRDTPGRMDEVWAYSRALSEGEVEMLYNQSF